MLLKLSWIKCNSFKKNKSKIFEKITILKILNSKFLAIFGEFGEFLIRNQNKHKKLLNKPYLKLYKGFKNV